jgi:hypothetical protein
MQVFIGHAETTPLALMLKMFCRPDQFSRSSYVDENSCWLVSSLPSLFFTMSSHRDIYIYKC